MFSKFISVNAVLDQSGVRSPQSKKKRTAPCEPPAMKIVLASRWRRGSPVPTLHPFLHLRFHSVQVEARALLHRRIFKEGLKFLADDLLDEHKAPELILEPVEVLLRTFFRPVVRPAGAFGASRRRSWCT